jgi:glycosyltransferase involved in cell wall biosynthesis
MNKAQENQGQLLNRDLTICDNPHNYDCIKCLFYQLSIKRGVMGIYQSLQHSALRFLIPPLKTIYGYYAQNTFLSKAEAIRQIEKRNVHIKELCQMVGMFIAPSQFLKKRFCAFGIPEEKIIFSPYGLNTEAFKALKKSNSNKLRFAYIGTLLPAKGVDILIKAFNRIGEEGGELKIYGPLSTYKGYEYYLKYIRNLARNKNIKFMGGYDNKDVSKIFSEVDVLIVPSIWYENSPLVIQEAQLAGVPVIASRIGGITELIQDGENGLLFEPRNPDDLYNRMMIFIHNPDLTDRFRMSINLPKSIEENGQEMEELYMSI